MMKQILVLAAIFFVAGCSQRMVCVYPTKMNYLYQNIRNPITVVSTKKFVDIISNNGRVLSDGNTYDIVPDSLGKLQLKLRYKHKEITYSFNVIPIDTSQLMFVLRTKGGSGIYTKNSNYFLQATWENADYNSIPKVKHFSCDLIKSGFTLFSSQTSGNEFDSSFLNKLQLSQGAVQIKVYDIVVVYENGNTLRSNKKIIANIE